MIEIPCPVMGLPMEYNLLDGSVSEGFRLFSCCTSTTTPVFSFRASVGLNQVLGQMALELVAISYTFQAPDSQLLTKKCYSLIRKSEAKERRTSLPELKSCMI